METTKDINANERKALLDKLSDSITIFIEKVDHPEDGVLIVKPQNPNEFKIVYIEDLLVPHAETEGWDEYPILEIIGGDDVAEIDWVLNPDELEQIIANYEL